MAHLLRLLNRTTNPTPTPASGETWYDSVKDQVLISDGQSGDPIVVGPYGNLPVVAAGRWHLLPAYGAQATANVPAGTMFALPFQPGRTCTLTAVAANVTLALVGGVLRFGLYTATAGGLPGALVSDFGTVSVGVTGIRQISGLSTVVRPVLHYLVVGRQGGAVNLGLTTRATGDPIVSEASPTIAGNFSAYTQTGITGALPASFGTPAGVDTGPSIAAQLS
jgi:hypothetical protein